MRRRDAIRLFGVASMLWVPAAEAQRPARLAWIGSTQAATSADFLAAFRAGMRDNGLVEEKDYVLDLFWSEGDYTRFPKLVEAALARDPAVLLVVTISSVRAAQRATKMVPIVFMSTNDPVGAGLVTSLARPGGNTTGVATMADDTASKLVELVREMLPEAKRLAVIINPDNATNRPIFARIRASADPLGMAADAIEVSSPGQIDEALAAIARQPPDALLIGFDASFLQQGSRIATLGLQHRVAVFGNQSIYVHAGALVAYGASRRAIYHRAAFYVKRILSGAKPGDLPVEQPTTFELTLNLKTARALGLTIPPAILARADEVIE